MSAARKIASNSPPNAEDDGRLARLRRLALDADAPSSMKEHRRSVALPPLLHRVALLAAGVAVGGATTFYFVTTSDRHLSDSQKRVIAAATPRSTPAIAASASPSIIAAGYVVAQRQATVAAEITGRITSLPVHEGDFVKAGTVLATLDDRLARSDLVAQENERQGAALAIDGAQAELIEARLVHQRALTLKAKGFATDAVVTAAASRERALEADAARARTLLSANAARVVRMRNQVANYVIRAPFDGIVVERNAQVGEVVSPISAGGGFTRTGICTLVDMSSLAIEVDVAEAYIARIAVGRPAIATLDAYPGAKFPVKVSAIIPAVNRQKATVTVRLTLDRPDPRILPNMATKVSFAA